MTVIVTRELPEDMVEWSVESGPRHPLSDCVGVISLIGEC